jgi:hypothetical protein
LFWSPEIEPLQRPRDLGLARAVLAVPASSDMHKLSAPLDQYAELAQQVK